MDIHEMKRLVRRYYEDVVSTGNVELLPDYLSPDYVEVHEGVRYEVGLSGARQHIDGVRGTYQNLTITVDHQICEGEWVVSCITVTGIHVGEWGGIPPTGKRLIFTGVNVDRVVDGRIVEHGGAANMLGPLMAAGAVGPMQPEA